MTDGEREHNGHLSVVNYFFKKLLFYKQFSCVMPPYDNLALDLLANRQSLHKVVTYLC